MISPLIHYTLRLNGLEFTGFGTTIQQAISDAFQVYFAALVAWLPLVRQMRKADYRAIEALPACR